MTSHTQENGSTNIDLSAYMELFLTESQTFLTTLRESLIQLKDSPTDAEILREARRAAHTLKGMASTMHYEDLADLATGLENQMESGLPLTPDQINVLLLGCDEFELGLARLDKSHNEQGKKEREQ